MTGTYSVAPQAFLSHAGNCLIGQEGGTNYGAIRLSMRWTPSDQVEVNVVGDVTQQDQENSATTLLYANLSGNAFYNQITIPTTSGAQLGYSSAAVPAMILLAAQSEAPLGFVCQLHLLRMPSSRAGQGSETRAASKAH